MRFSLFYQLPCSDDQSDIVRYKQTIEQIQHGEELGFDCAWLAELHFYEPFSIMPAPLIVAAAIAQKTRRIRLGIAVSLLPLWHPLRSAEEGATVDLLSDGRLEFGVGRGAIPLHFAGYDVPREESRERFEEALQIIKNAWTTESFSYEGRFHRIPETSVVPKPVQKPHPPIRVAANGPDTALFAGRERYPILVASVTNPLPRMYGHIDRYREAWQLGDSEPAGPGPDVATMFFVYPGDDLSRVRSRVAPSLDHYFQSVLGMARAVAPPKDSSQSYHYLEEVHSSVANITFEEIAEKMAIFGSPDECAERIAKLHARLGMDELLCWFNPGGRVPHRDVLEAMSRFAVDVAPKLRHL
jgi:alkanesulfonate monooxygenase SsuD/methylene tetrahydromethanopterin reductase-like flavin-dependent oxidoreductase (luciferase family)